MDITGSGTTADPYDFIVPANSLVATAWVEIDDGDLDDAAWTTRVGYHGFAYRKVGDMVQLRGVLDTNADDGPVMGVYTLPVGFRPPTPEVASGYLFPNYYYDNSGAYAGDSIPTISVQSNGGINAVFSFGEAPQSFVFDGISFSITG